MPQLTAVAALQAAPRGPWAPRACPGAAAAAGAACAWPAHAPQARLPAGSRSRGSLTRLRVAYQQAPNSSDTDEDADYYKILGVSYTASTDEIKRAYRRLAKEYHPDVSADDEATEFAMFLNDVYQTLSDPDKRAAYDAIAGFEIGGVNPFVDTSYERDQVFVDEFTCIGCKNCNNVCPSTFMMEEEWGRARVRDQGVDGVEKLQEAIDTCPVSCIHWVTAPQLTLLEETMGRMERVAAWLLMTGGGKGANLNVFMEAATAWEKRQSALRARAQAEAGWAPFWARSTPATGSRMQDAARAAAEGGGGSSTLGRGVNAATIAKASRKWRDWQRTKRNKASALITASSSVSSSTDA